MVCSTIEKNIFIGFSINLSIEEKINNGLIITTPVDLFEQLQRHLPATVEESENALEDDGRLVTVDVRKNDHVCLLWQVWCQRDQQHPVHHSLSLKPELLATDHLRASHYRKVCKVSCTSVPRQIVENIAENGFHSHSYHR